MKSLQSKSTSKTNTCHWGRTPRTKRKTTLPLTWKRLHADFQQLVPVLRCGQSQHGTSCKWWQNGCHSCPRCMWVRADAHRQAWQCLVCCGLSRFHLSAVWEWPSGFDLKCKNQVNTFLNKHIVKSLYGGKKDKDKTGVRKLAPKRNVTVPSNVKHIQ